MRNNRRSLLAIGILFLAAFIFSRCLHEQPAFNDPRGKLYAGAAACRQCHQAIYDSFMLSAHQFATSDGDKKNIHGNFSNGQNIFVFDEHTKVTMEERNNRLFQVLYKDGKETEARSFDITFGTRNAQTWLYWDSGAAYELPVSWYTSVHSWATSPGFSPTIPNFRRFIGKDCFECHSSHISSKMEASTAGIKEVLSRQSLIYGIDCERCHGPAANHVSYHLDNPSEKKAMYIALYSTLSQQQKLDACALCHSGNDKMKIESRFRFKPGDSLSDFFMERSVEYKNDFDVHGNQYRLLAESKCFISSKSMTCSTCHDPHRNASEMISTYSQKCISCHKEVQHRNETMSRTQAVSKQTCIGCHMPKQPSQAISFYLQNSKEKSSYLLRTHRIAVYADSLITNIQKK